MKTILGMMGMGILFFGLSSAARDCYQSKEAGGPTNMEKPGDIERAALGKVDFLVGEWQGEGWRLTRSGQRERFWVIESYRYRGNKDLLDMEGRFGDILPDGTKSAEQRYGLGILFYDRQSQDYFMWHYNSDGTVFTAKMEIDVKDKSASYLSNYTGEKAEKFSVGIEQDGTWLTKLEILRPDNSWLRVMEFRMKRVG